MAVTRKFIAVIPARGGSKGLPGKNMAILGGKPLIQWTIEAALGCEFIDDVVVSSDSNEILNFARSCNVEAVKRPMALATDDAATAPVITHALRTCDGDNFSENDYLVLLQPTSPLRTSYHIEEAISVLSEQACDGVISVCRIPRTNLKAFYLSEGFLKGAVNNEAPFSRRQDLPQAFAANGAIYISNIVSFLETESLLSEKTVPFIMDAENSIDIDTADDLKLASKLIEQIFV